VTENTVFCIKHFSAQFIITRDTAPWKVDSILTVARLTRSKTLCRCLSVRVRELSSIPYTRATSKETPSWWETIWLRTAWRCCVWGMVRLHSDINRYEQLVQNANEHLSGDWKYAIYDDSVRGLRFHFISLLCMLQMMCRVSRRACQQCAICLFPFVFVVKKLIYINIYGRWR